MVAFVTRTVGEFFICDHLGYNFEEY